VISLTTTGDTNWVYRYNGPGNGNDGVFSITYGTDGNIYAVGYSTVDMYDFTVISLTTTGDTNWVYLYNGPANDNDYAHSIIYGVDGNIYAAGSSQGSDTYEDFTVISLTTTGDTNWVYRYDGPIYDYANSIVYGADGNIYAAGSSWESTTSNDFTVISLTTNGDTNWVYRYNGSANYTDYANSIIYGADGNIYAAGRTQTGTFDDFTVISLTTSSDTNWVYRYNGPGNYYDEANSIVYGADGNIYAAGRSQGIGTYADFTVISLPGDYGVEEDNKTVLKTSFNATILSGPLQLPAGKNCKTFDIMGRVVIPDQLKPGVYFIQIDNQIVQTVVKVR